jgi:DNA-binding response OmpR family regulator
MSRQILVVDDDPLLRRSLAFNLERSGYQVQTAASAEGALELIRNQPPDLILLDIGLPGMDGLAALRVLRDQVPVIFVTARHRQLDEVLGLELGAEDYITKPFEFEVLLARVRTVLRRTEKASPAATQQSTRLVVGDLIIDPARYTVTVAGRAVSLPPREFRLLSTLAWDAGHVIATEALIARVWGAEFAGETQTVYVHIRSLREKLEIDPQRPQRIVTVRGVGYKLMPQEG